MKVLIFLHLTIDRVLINPSHIKSPKMTLQNRENL